MFRNEYKRANDNIKIDEALLEKTLNTAFSPKPKKSYYYHHISSIAAALVVVIGVGYAYPKLVQKPVIEGVVINTPVPEETKDKSYIVPAPAKDVSDAGVTPKAVHSRKTEAPVREVDEDINVTVAETEQITGDALQNEVVTMPAMARSIGDNPVAYNGQENVEDKFVQQSCTEENGIKVYTYQNSQGKTFTVTMEPYAENMNTVDAKNTIVEGDFVYTLFSENMTDEELVSAFESISI